MIAAVTVGAALIAAAPAVAKKPEKTLVVSTHVTNARTVTGAKAAALATAAIAPGSPGDVIRTSYRSECTTPNNQNLVTSNTIEGWGANDTLVSDCFALLWLKTSTTGSFITWDSSFVAQATVQSCRLYSAASQNQTILGTGFVTTTPIGLFVETCTADQSLPPS